MNFETNNFFSLNFMGEEDSTQPYKKDEKEEEKALDAELGSRRIQPNPEDRAESEQMEDPEVDKVEKEYDVVE